MPDVADVADPPNSPAVPTAAGPSALPAAPRTRLDELTERARRIVTATSATAAPPPGPKDPGYTYQAGSSRLPVGDLPGAPFRGLRTTSRVALAPGDGGIPETPAAAETVPSRLVLGIDPGTATMGYGIVRVTLGSPATYVPIDYGVVITLPGEPMHLRLRTLYERLRSLIEEHHPTDAVVEKLFFGRNTTTALTVGQARGVALLAIAQANLTVAEYTPAEVKFALSSYGRASKSDMQRMTQLLLRLPTIPTPDDAADALAVALCHAHSMRANTLGLR